MKKLSLLVVLCLISMTTAPSLMDIATSVKDSTISFTGSTLTMIGEGVSSVFSKSKTGISDIINAYPSLSQNQKQTLGLTLLLPAIYCLYANISNDAEAKQKERSGIPFQNHFMARKVGIVASAAAIGLAVKALIDGSKVDIERLEKAIASISRPYVPQVSDLN